MDILSILGGIKVFSNFNVYDTYSKHFVSNC